MLIIEKEFEMAHHYSEHELSVEIVAGDTIGFSDTVEYEAVAFAVVSYRSHLPKQLDA